MSKQKLDGGGRQGKRREGTAQANRREEERRVDVRREERGGETSGPSQSHSWKVRVESKTSWP